MTSCFGKVAALCLVAIGTSTLPGIGAAASLDEVVARLDKVEAENAALRARLRRLEGTAPQQANAAKPKQVASADFQQANARLETKAAVWNPPPQKSWNGLYVGLNLGGAWGNETGIATPGFASLETRQRVAGASGGGQVGVNLQYNRVVLGAELSADWRDVKGSSLVEGGQPSALNPLGNVLGGCAVASDTPFPLAGAALKTFSCNARQDWTVNVLSRFGYSLLDDSLLVYGKGGVSFSHFFFSDEFKTFQSGIGTPAAVISGSASRNLVGATIGGGLEYRIPSTQFSVGAEYLYSMYGSQPFAPFYRQQVPPLGNQGASDTFFPGRSFHSLNTELARVFVNYRFDQ
jgi:outer membrane immunogenic protein